LAAPRNAHQASDGRWLGLSGTTQSIAVRVMRIVGRPDLIDEPCSSTTQGGSNTPMSWTRRSRPGSVGTRPLMQNVIPRLTATPGRIGHAGAALREHNVEILCGELGVTEEELASLTADGVVADVPAPVPSTGEDAE
jgi:crotonobetainyl-CoA:carnitine CoA-transferase CaiB-like acyl-CoA transferase